MVALITLESITTIKEIEIIGTKLTLWDKKEFLHYILARVQSCKKTLILSGNVYSFNLAYENKWLQSFFNKADGVRLDGAGLRWGAALLGEKTPSRITWADIAWDFADFCAKHDLSLFLLGSHTRIVNKAAERLKHHAQGLRIVGTYHGYFRKEVNHKENRDVLYEINKQKPDILIVGFGMPLQERWLSENWHNIEANVTLTAGAVFDWVTGEQKRGPQWMINYGFEWLARLLNEPHRLWQRYLIGNPKFILRVIKQKVGI